MTHAGSTLQSLSCRAPCPLRPRRSMSCVCRVCSAIPRVPFVLCPLSKDLRPADARPGASGYVRVKSIHPDAFSALYSSNLNQSVRAVRVKCNIMHMCVRARARAINLISVLTLIFLFIKKHPDGPDITAITRT
jgi:hypothetical protein